MNYKRIHDSIIDMARARSRPTEYSERHHVVPRSMGGEDCPSNLVWLTAREHYVIHWMLYKIHKSKEMAFAWYRMTAGKQSISRYTSHSFAYAKAARAKAMSALFSGKSLPGAQKLKLSEAKKGRTYSEMGRGESPLKGRSLSDSHKEKVRLAGIGRSHSLDAKEKLRLSKLGAKNPNYGKVTSEATKKKISSSLSKACESRAGAVVLSIGGIAMTAAAWARSDCCEVSASTITARLRKGWSAKDAVLAPALPRRAPSHDELRAIRDEYRQKLKQITKGTL